MYIKKGKIESHNGEGMGMNFEIFLQLRVNKIRLFNFQLLEIEKFSVTPVL